MPESVSHAPESLFDEALDAIDRERAETRDERDALQAFLERVRELSAHRPTSTVGFTLDQAHSSESDSLGAIRDAYESTVMAVPHYEAEYGEPFATNVAEELGPDVATLLTSGQLFERHHKLAIVTAAEETRKRRSELLDVLDEEQRLIEQFREPVCTTASDLDSLEATDPSGQPPELLDGYRKRLEVLRNRCHELIERRQSELVGNRRAMALPITGPDIPTYVYQDLPVNYPIIATLTEILQRAATYTASVDVEIESRSRQRV